MFLAYFVVGVGAFLLILSAWGVSQIRKDMEGY